MKRFLAHLNVMAAASAIGISGQQPHLIYILADDYGWFNVGFHNKEMHTPNIDNLATVEGAEIKRMYAYRFCSPSRASLMSGRLPYHVNQNNSAQWGWDSAPIHPEMTLLPEKLQEVGYFTVQVGKWHLGLSKQAYTPAGRGFNTSLTMLMGSEDHFDQRNGMKGHKQKHIDLWETDEIAMGRNGTYSAELFGYYAVKSILEHSKQRSKVPLFMYLAFTVTHEPIQAPQRFIDMYPSDWVGGRRIYAAMASALDEEIGKVTTALKNTGMWENTLILFSSDNGGPSLVGKNSFANNYPLRGGKGDAFEGGTRVCAFVSGGLLPKSQLGRQLPTRGHAHVADAYQTFCGLSGHSNCEDSPGHGVPSTDSFDLWPMLSGRTQVSPRNETVLEYRVYKYKGPASRQGVFDGALLSGDWKYIVGKQSGNGYWFGPEYPNSTVPLAQNASGCPDGCLFNITGDPTEHHDLAGQYPLIKAQLKSRLDQLGATVYQSDINGALDTEGAIAAAVSRDWWCPWLDRANPLVV